MSKRAELKRYTQVQWPCFKGKRIVFYSLPYRLPYTRAALARLEARVTAKGEAK